MGSGGAGRRLKSQPSILRAKAMVVVDEAHALRTEGPLLRAIHALRILAASIILCTATPLHNSEKVSAHLYRARCDVYHSAVGSGVHYPTKVLPLFFKNVCISSLASSILFKSFVILNVVSILCVYECSSKTSEFSLCNTRCKMMSFQKLHS